ncbi:hypothetical protein OS493_027327 [Desmophyllum pertusum]|uniref:Uncharacterized protein n=1 Tax=Desmophyllum pertusum TaxID=174260 RepID=A0A9W9Z021_9CNID|nr:hypothetical protein OS493_027327 [Desmophyllum pertusum]
MSRSQTSTSVRSTTFHSVGMSSGLAIHEREREEERRRRAKLSRQASNSSERPLFPEPKKVQPSVGDILQQQIHATLGTYETIEPSLLQHSNHLFGIPRLPQTPVEGDQKFIFDPKSKYSKNSTIELKKAQASLKTVNRITKEELKSSKIPKVNGVLNGNGHPTAKSTLATKSHDTIALTKNSTLSHLKSPPVNENSSSKSTESKKTLLHSKSPSLKETTPSKSTELRKTLTSHLTSSTVNDNASSKSTDTRKTLSHLTSPTLKDTTPSKSTDTRKTLSHLTSPTPKETTPSKSVEMKKTDIKPVVNGVFKSRQGDNKDKEKGSVKVKGSKEGKGHGESENGESCKEKNNRSNSSNKSKPPKIKLSMPERNLPVSSVELENLAVHEPTNVEKIIAEMQQVAPPLTGIHTPIKGGNSIFAFHRNSIQDNSMLPVLPIKRKASENTEAKKDSGNGVVLMDDLMLSDESDDEHDHQTASPTKTSKTARHRSHSTSSSGSSSDDSDSDSSDSDSDSSGSDTNNNTKDKPVKSPVHVPSSSPKPASGRKWGLDQLYNALNQSSTSPTQRQSQAHLRQTLWEKMVSEEISTHEKKSPAPPVSVDTLAPFAADLLSNSPEIDHGVDIESLTAKLDVPCEADVALDTAKPVSSELGQNGSSVKIQLPKDSNKGKRRLSTAGSKLNSGQEKSQSENSPKKPLKAKKETDL